MSGWHLIQVKDIMETQWRATNKLHGIVGEGFRDLASLELGLKQ